MAIGDLLKKNDINGIRQLLASNPDAVNQQNEVSL